MKKVYILYGKCKLKPHGIRLHFIPISMTILKKTKQTAGKTVGKEDIHTWLVGAQTSGADVEISMRSPKSKLQPAYDMRFYEPNSAHISQSLHLGPAA